MNNIKNSSLNWLVKIGLGVIVTAMVMMLVINSKSLPVAGGEIPSDGEVNQVILHEANTPSSLGSSYADAGNHHVRHVDFDYYGAKASAGHHVELAANGFIGNDQGTRLTSITSITVTYSASSSMKIATSNRNDGLGLNDKVNIASGVAFEPTNAPYYFRLYAGGVATQVTSIDICYTCVEQASGTYFIENLSEQFSGSNGGVDFLLTRSGSAAVLKTLNLSSNIELSDGVISISGDEITITATGLTYVGELSDNGHLITFVSASGAYAAALTGLNLNAVYNLEDYESYSGEGLGIRSSATGKYGHTGLRAAYYSDYYGGGTGSPLGGNGWQLMSSSDYLSLFTGAGESHSGSAAGKFKRSTAGAMRHISWDLYTGNALVVGKGDTFSFWAKGVASNVEVKPRVAYVPLIHASNQTSTSDTATAVISIPANSPWTQYTFALNSAKPVYGFQFSFTSSSATVYVPVDDVQIYTATNPWSEYVAPVAVTGVSVSPETMDLEIGQNGNVTASISPENATNQNVSWSSEDELVATVNSSGQVSAVGVGQALIVASTADGSFEDACIVTVSIPLDGAPLNGRYSGTTEITGYGSKNITIVLTNNYNAYISAPEPINDVYAIYTIDTNVVSISTENSYIGTIVATFNSDRTILTKNSISGTAGPMIGSLVMNKVSETVLEDGNNTTTSALQSKYSTYNLTTGSNIIDTDRIQYKTSNPNPIEGDGCVALKSRTDGEVRYKSNDMSTSFGTFSKYSFWLYNGTNSALTIKLLVYTVNGSSFNEFVVKEFAKTDSWIYYTASFTTQTVAGIAFRIVSSSSVGYPCIDRVSVF